MKPYSRHYFLFTFFLFLLLVATAPSVNGAGDYLEQMGVARINENIDAPPFILPDLKGRKRSLREFKGKFVMLNFWATWWPYCDRERSSLEKIHNLYGNRGLIVLAISIDQGSDEKVRKLVKSYVSRKKLTFLNLLDPKSSTATQYGVSGVPTNLFINPQGKVVAFSSGYRKWDSKAGLLMIEELLSSAKATKKWKWI